MDVVIGGFLAALIAWATIFPLTRIDFRKRMNMRIFRMFGGMAIVTIALIIAGAGLPEYLPLAIVCIGFIIAWMKR